MQIGLRRSKRLAKIVNRFRALPPPETDHLPGLCLQFRRVNGGRGPSLGPAAGHCSGPRSVSDPPGRLGPVGPGVLGDLFFTAAAGSHLLRYALRYFFQKGTAISESDMAASAAAVHMLRVTAQP